jgi:hypothetical protein
MSLLMVVAALLMISAALLLTRLSRSRTSTCRRRPPKSIPAPAARRPAAQMPYQSDVTPDPDAEPAPAVPEAVPRLRTPLHRPRLVLTHHRRCVGEEEADDAVVQPVSLGSKTAKPCRPVSA